MFWASVELVKFGWTTDLPIIAFQRMNLGVTIFSLLAIPFFKFAGEVMLHGGISISALFLDAIVKAETLT